ncbi:sodium-dependent bicarbonate transport family permease [Zooshikella harenae]|uniref:Sodium-dependent bicarbonate transport family permease n=1 Tax=Zooshikella harenae TaxID=2827238 RepID=A0ABS5ZIR1_9GAMM|nr:sodium-dependent bicarbonate transport family permease [Zooshikella harenae]MBU2713912.1 sodium-dependent bicarbonate transport family permease [Zooshikella harenae]
MQLDVVVAFFILGIIAKLMRAELVFPKGLSQTLTLFLMIAIGLKGGVALADHADSSLITQALAVIAFGVMLTFIAFPILTYFGQLAKTDAASIAAHYGSVSVGTYAVAVALLESQSITYEAYFPLFVVLLELPAIAVGIFLAKGRALGSERRKLLHEMFCSQGVVLMLGGLVIGWIWGEQTQQIMPFFKGLFHGVLALFLLDMGLTAASRIDSFKSTGSFIATFGVVMPLIGGLLGGLLAKLLGLSVGGIALLAVLGASASYIAVPAALRVALPKANMSLSITSSLAVTFPFNVLVGIPIYIAYGHWLA